MSHLHSVPSPRPPSSVPSSRPSLRRSDAPVRRRQESAAIAIPSHDLVFDYTTSGCVIAHIGNVTFSAWNTTPVMEHIEAFMTVAKSLSTKYAHSSNVTLVMRNSDLPDTEVRVALEQFTTQYAGAIHSVALVIDGDGFWASMIRSFLTGLHLLRGHGYRCKAFGTFAEAAPWLVPTHSADTGFSLTTRELEAACEAVYQRMHELGVRG